MATTPLHWFAGCQTLEELHRRFIELSRQYHPDLAGEDPHRREQLGRIQQDITAEFQRMKTALELLPLLPHLQPPAARPRKKVSAETAPAETAPKDQPKPSAPVSTRSSSSGRRRSATRSSVPPPATSGPSPRGSGSTPDLPASGSRPVTGGGISPAPGISSQLLMQKLLARGIELGFRWLERRIEQASERADDVGG